MSFPHIYSANDELYGTGIHKMRLPTGPSPSHYNPHLTPWDARTYHDEGRLRDDERTIVHPRLRQMEGSIVNGGGAPSNAFMQQALRKPFVDDIAITPQTVSTRYYSTQ